MVENHRISIRSLKTKSIHDTFSDAECFLAHKTDTNTINTPSEALDKVKMIAKLKVSTWEEVAAAVFSNSSEENSVMTVTTVKL